MLQVSFDEPAWLQSGSGRYATKVAHWEAAKKALPHGSLVCLWAQASDADPPSIVFGVVSERDPKQLAVQRPVIGIRCAGMTLPGSLVADVENRKWRNYRSLTSSFHVACIGRALQRPGRFSGFTVL